MLLSTRHKLPDLIVQLFTQKPLWTAREVHVAIERLYRDYTERAIYKELANLHEAGVLVKVKNKFGVSLPWVLKLSEFSEELYRVNSSPSAQAYLLPASGDRCTWQFTDLRRMDNFWLQLIFLLLERSPSNCLFEWVPHYWFHLLHFEKEKEVVTALEAAGYKIFLNIGSDTYLNRLPEKYWSKKAYEWSYAPGLFKKLTTDYICVTETYILTVKLDRATMEWLDDLVREVEGPENLNLGEILNKFEQPSRIKMSLEHNEKKAVKLRQQFCNFFGVY